MPLPYLLGFPVCRVFHSIYALRLLNWLIAFLAAVVFLIILNRMNTPIKHQLLLLFVSNPYFLRSASVYYMTNYGILFSLAALYFYFFGKTRHSYAFAHIFALLAVLSMQWMLMLYLAFSLYEFHLRFTQRIKNAMLFKYMGIKLVTLLPVLFLVYEWRGLTHPRFKAHVLSPSFESLNILLAILGFLFAVHVIFTIKSLRHGFFVMVIYLAPIIYLKQPVFSVHQGVGMFPGLESNLLRHVETYLHIPYSITLLILTVVGLAVYFQIFSVEKSDCAEVVYYIICGLSVAFVSSTLLGSAHVYIIVPFVLLLLIRQLERMGKYLWIMNTQWYLTSLSYLFYYVLVKSRGLSI